MRSFGWLAVRQIRARRGRALLTVAGIVLGVGMILGVLLLTATINRTFSDLYDSVYGESDLIVAGADQSSLRASTLNTVERTADVEAAVGRVTGVFSLIGEGADRAEIDPGEDLNVAGEPAGAPQVDSAETVSGRDPARGREIMLQQSWADAQGVDLKERVSLATPDGEKRFRVVGMFSYQSGFEFGGEGFAVIPLETARRVLDRPRRWDEIDVIVAGGGESTIAAVERRLERALPKGADVDTPQAKSEDVESQLQAFNAILYFFAAIALFVGGFLIFNSFNMTVVQRTREIGMLRTLGASRSLVVGSVLREAALLGFAGAALGLALGAGLAYALAGLLRSFDFPIGDVVFAWYAPPAAVATGIATAVLGALQPARRAGRTSPVRAVLGGEGVRARPGRGRVVVGAALVLAGLAGAFWLGAAEETTTLVAAAGMAGTVAIFFGIAALAPFGIRPLVRLVSWPVRRAFPVDGRLAADAARSDPSRTAATATALLIGLAMVVAVDSLGTSFLSSISAEFDRAFARDLTVQPRGFAPGRGPQQTIADSLHDRLERIPEAEVVARERFVYTSEMPGPQGRTGSEGLLLAFDPLEYEAVDTTDVEGASREQVFRRMERGRVTVGKGFADEEGVEVGDTIRLDGPSGERRAKVAGIVQTVVFGGQTVSMSLATMRDVYGVTADSQLALKAASARERPILERKVERIVESDHPNLAVLSNEELKADVEEQVNQQFGIFYAIVGVAIFASLFGIVNTLTISVLERTREIGVLRALGASRWQVRRQVASESVVIGLIGALLGIAVGAGLGYALLQGLAAGIPGVEYEAPVATMAWVAIAGIGLGLIAAILPARRAARLDVIEAISYE